MATKNTGKGSTAKKAAGIGAGVLAVAGAAAGYYFYGDKNAKKHRQAASKWAKGMKTEVVREAKRLKKIDQKTMAKIVDKAAAVYEGARAVDRKDLRQAANELKRNWELVKREIGGSTKRVAKKAPARARKTVKKVAKKAKKAAKRAR